MTRRAERLSTAHLVLEPLRVSHAAAMVDVLADVSLYRFTGGQPPGIRELTERYRRQVAGHSPDGREQWLNWILTGPDTPPGAAPVTDAPTPPQTPLGFVQATVSTKPTEDTAELAWVVSPAHQGRGFASEAAGAVLAWLRTSGVTAFTAHIRPDHLASQAVARRLGLHPTTTLVDGEELWSARVPPRA